jgi:IS30 family transposase
MLFCSLKPARKDKEVKDANEKKGLPAMSITYDNGGEFADHQTISKKIGADIYFARTYRSHERGLNEHTICRAPMFQIVCVLELCQE